MQGQGQANSATEASRETQVLAALTQLDAATINLQKTAEDIKERLTGVLRQQGLEKSGEASPKPVKVPLAEMIDEKTERVRFVDNRLRDLLSRLEV